jgi:hypothetical protein
VALYVLYGVCMCPFRYIYSHDRVNKKTCITYLYPKRREWPSLLIGFQPPATSFGYRYNMSSGTNNFSTQNEGRIIKTYGGNSHGNILFDGLTVVFVTQ